MNSYLNRRRFNYGQILKTLFKEYTGTVNSIEQRELTDIE